MRESHSIPENVRNSVLREYINEYVRLERDRAILGEHWFCGMSFEAIAEKHEISSNAVKRIVYGIGDKILLRATK